MQLALRVTSIRGITHLHYCCFHFRITFHLYILPGVSSVASVLQTSCCRSWLTGALVPFLLSRPKTQQHEYHQNRDLTTKKQRPVLSICRNRRQGTLVGKFLRFFRINGFTRPAFQVRSEVESGFKNPCLHQVDLFLSVIRG